MAITGTEYNYTLMAYNSLSQASVAITPGMSDIDIVARLCTDYHFYVLLITGITLLLFFAKATLHRFAKRRPDQEWLVQLRDSADGLIEVALILVTVIQFCIALYFYLG